MSHHRRHEARVTDPVPWGSSCCKTAARTSCSAGVRSDSPRPARTPTPAISTGRRMTGRITAAEAVVTVAVVPPALVAAFTRRAFAARRRLTTGSYSQPSPSASPFASHGKHKRSGCAAVSVPLFDCLLRTDAAPASPPKASKASNTEPKQQDDDDDDDDDGNDDGDDDVSDGIGDCDCTPGVVEEEGSVAAVVAVTAVAAVAAVADDGVVAVDVATASIALAAS